MNAKQELLKNIRNGTFALLTDREISAKLRLGKTEAAAVRDMLASLVREGRLFCDSDGRLGTAEQFGAVRGTFTGNERGFGFFIPEEGEDLFIPARARRGAMHKDTVLAFRKGGRRGDEGEILAVLERGYRTIVGTYRRDRRAGRLIPDDRKFDAEISIPTGKQGPCRDGCKAVARILSYGRTIVGEIVEELGRAGDFFTEELSLLRAHGLGEEFPADVSEEAARMPLSVSKEACAGRTDLRKSLVVTVDGEDTRDIDDAISVEKHGDRFLLGVHIADVTHYVRGGSPLDREAFRRGTSVYFPDRVLPMLPPALSNGICSLNEGEDRLTLSCLLTVDGRGKVLERAIVPSVIRSRHRMTYSEVDKIFRRDPEAAEKYADLLPTLSAAEELTRILKAARKARGGLTLDVKEAKIVYADGKIEIPDYERTLAHEMIEQFMVLANENVAEIMTEKNAPFVYRVHERPAEEKANDFAVFLKEVGIAPRFDPKRVSPKDYRTLLSAVEGKPYASLVNRVMLRSMMKARYSPENCGHFGIASDCYCHFTSPIRRYPDLCIHRIIKEMFADPERAQKTYREEVSGVSEQASLTERNAADAEREVDALYIVAYMHDRIGETYDAVVSGVTAYGLFAELANTIEGFISLDMLPDDGYEFFEERFLLRGTKNSFRLGQSVRVKTVGVDWGTRRVQFALVPPEK